MFQGLKKIKKYMYNEFKNIISISKRNTIVAKHKQ